MTNTSRQTTNTAVDPWRAGLEAALDGLDEALLVPVTASAESWEENSTIDDEALAAANPGHVQASVASKVSALITWAKGRYVEAHGGAAKANSQFASRHESTLRRRCLVETARANEALSAYFELQQQIRAAVDEDSSFGTLATNFFRGFVGDPTVFLEGGLELFGQGPSSRRMKELVARDSAAQSALVTTVESIRFALDTIFVEWWNHTVLPECNETSAPIAKGGGSKWKDLLGLAAVLLFFGAGAYGLFQLATFGYRSFWPSAPPAAASSPAPAAQPAISIPSPSTHAVMIAKGTKVLKGPGPNFGKVTVVKTAASAVVLDDSVPGWRKIRIGSDTEGWIVSQAGTP